MGASTRSGRPFSVAAVLPALIVDGLFPFLTYKLLMQAVSGMSPARALACGAVFPALRVTREIGKRRRLDIIGVLVLVGIGAGLLGLALGGGPKLFLLRESLVTGVFALVALSSFAWPRPMMFYVGRQFAAGDHPVAVQAFNASWQSPYARRAFRIMTLVWAVGWLSEAALKVIMVLTLSIPQVLAISPIVFHGITLGLIAWTIAYGTGVRRRQQRTNEPAAPTPFELQPTLAGDLIEVRPLRREDFDALFRAASDPLIWEHHPESTRYQRDVFQRFFQDAMASGGAFAVVERVTGRMIGSSRYANLKEAESQVEIGWTFLERAYWGGVYNRELKQLMIDHALKCVERVVFVVGEHNQRSQQALRKIGAELIGPADRPAQDGSRNLVFGITRTLWRRGGS